MSCVDFRKLKVFVCLSVCLAAAFNLLLGIWGSIDDLFSFAADLKPSDEELKVYSISFEAHLAYPIAGEPLSIFWSPGVK